MVSAASPAPTGAKPEKPSFAKVLRLMSSGEDAGVSRINLLQIAATGLKPSSVLQKPSNNTASNPKHSSSSTSQDHPVILTSSYGLAQKSVAADPPRVVQEQGTRHRAQLDVDTSNPEVRVQGVASLPRPLEGSAPDGLLVPGASDDAGTQISSSSGSNQPHSFDGKSVASGTTFALDEKESLRPDDSASVKAVEDEDVFSAPGSGLPGSRHGSDDGFRAFRDQLREISLMEPTGNERSSGPSPSFGNVPKGVLYVPPQGPGVGMIPGPSNIQGTTSSSLDRPPDLKLLEALENPRDRVWVLKLEQDVIDFVNNPTESALTLPQCHSFYRLLAHKMADYYGLDHFVDDTSAAVRLFKTPYCRIPPPLTGITTPSTAASTPPPSAPMMKILRRGIDKAGPGNGSNLTSENGDDSNEDDKKAKVPLTREEREAKYEAARLRIMGSAKPSDVPEPPRDSQESRPSSTTGNKNKKKARGDSDDDFEARSAYSNYLTSTYTSDGAASTSYGYSTFPNDASGQYPMSPYGPQPPGATQQVPTQASAMPPWANQSYHAVDPSQSWAQGQHEAYGISTNMQRTMHFQSPLSPQSPGMNFPMQYPQSYYGQQPAWPQPQYDMPPAGQSPGYTSYPASINHYPEAQPYAYGQLPSQSWPGRPANRLEHPIPGSYKSKHFNPQSQTFVPGQAGPSGPSPFAPQGAQMTTNGFSPGFSRPGQLQRQTSAQSHLSSHGPSHQNSPALQHARPPPVMTHPLPQPVFPRQPSPHVPLPPKPAAVVPPMSSTAAGHSLAFSPHQNASAKWGPPASLPAKPPPPVSETADGSKSTQMQRPPFVSAAAAARQPSGGSMGVPTFGSMASPQIVNGTGPHSLPSKGV